MKKILMIAAVLLIALTGYSVVIMDEGYEGYPTGHDPANYPTATAVGRANAIDASSTIGDGNAVEFWDDSTTAKAFLEYNLCSDEAGEYQALHISFDLYNILPSGGVGEFAFGIGSYSSSTTYTLGARDAKYFALRFMCADGDNSVLLDDGTQTIDSTLTYDRNAANHYDIYINDGETGGVSSPDGTLFGNMISVYLNGTLLGKYSIANSPLSIGESSGLGRIGFLTGGSSLVDMEIDNVFVETISTNPAPVLVMEEGFAGYKTGRDPATYPPATAVGRANAIDASGTIGDGNAAEIWDTSTTAKAFLEYNLCSDESGEYGALHVSFDMYNILPSGGVGEFSFGIGSYSSSTTYTLAARAAKYFALRFSCADGSNSLLLDDGTRTIDNALTYNLNANNHFDVYINDSETDSISYPGGTLATNSMALYQDGSLMGEYSIADSPLSIGESSGLGRIGFLTGGSSLVNMEVDNILVERLRNPTSMSLTAANGSLTVSATDMWEDSSVTNVLQTRTNLVTGTWSNLYTITGVITTNWTLPVDSAQGFYRIQTTY